uniref:Uncharacterized protein n=2 Tax=Canis lupus familiaris TaxID=9615 RepID=A0A8C0MQG8_CANLF
CRSSPRNQAGPREAEGRGVAGFRLRKEARQGKSLLEGGVEEVAPFHTITRKPVSWHQNLEEPAEARFLNLIHQAAQGPRKRYPDTQTEKWYRRPDRLALTPGYHLLRRLNRVRVHSDIAPHKAKAWSWREDDRLAISLILF